MLVLFSAEPDAQLVLGWTRDTSREEYERRVADGTLGEILRKVPVKAGDSFYLPAGMVHAIGAGVVLFETQQASDLTYRIFDWNRVGADGTPRELHVQRPPTSWIIAPEPAERSSRLRITSKASIDWPSSPTGVSSWSALRRLPNRLRLRPMAGRLIVMSLDRPLEVACGDTATTLSPYQTALVPAAAQWCTVNGPDAKFMFVTPPQERDQLAVRLLAAGIDPSQIDRFMQQF